MKKEQTLRGRPIFEKTFREGRCINGQLVRCYALVESGTTVRGGFVVPRRKMNAVHRNRVKRLMREAFAREHGALTDRLQKSGLSASLLFIFRPSTAVDVERLGLGPVHSDVSEVCLTVSRKLQ